MVTNIYLVLLARLETFVEAPAHYSFLCDTDRNIVFPCFLIRWHALVVLLLEANFADALRVRAVLVQPARLDAALLVQAQELLADAGDVVLGLGEVGSALALALDRFLT